MTKPVPPEMRDREEAASPSQPATAPAAGCDLVQAMLNCPVCSCRLQEHRCKLTCPQCGYFMSCADYY